MTGAPVRVAIGSVRVRAASGIDARRLAATLPDAIAAALSEGAIRPARPNATERAAWQIADVVRAQREAQRWA